MTVALVRERIAEMQANIEGVRKAFRYAPRVIQHGELPAFVNLAGSATYDMSGYGEDEFSEPRMYRMMLFVQEVGQGTEGNADGNAEPFVERVQDYFNARTGLELDSESPPRGLAVFDAQLVGDDGIQYREYPLGSGNFYIAIEFRLMVTEIKSISYVSG